MNRALFLVALLLLLFPSSSLAATKATSFEVSGWIPYWRVTSGTADVLPHLANLTSVMPFGYIVQDDGSLHDAFGLDGAPATSTVATFVAAARAAKVRVVPTVMWSDTWAMARVLRDGPSRRALEDRIAALVKENGFDGIDIDFENKLAATRPYFSLFLQGLYMRMGKKFVYCTIEPRTPPSAAFDVPPKKLEYANDFVAINKYCDRVIIMAYDQGAIDLRLNSVASPNPYIPVADPRWVEKVVTLAAKTISKKKLVIGIPTYGYEYDLIPLSRGYRYELNWAFNPRYATELASALGLKPTRNPAGEMSFTYVPTSTPQTASALPDPARIVWWSDASAINDKVQLAKKLGVKGVAVFKFDGGEDQLMWPILQAARY